MVPLSSSVKFFSCPLSLFLVTFYGLIQSILANNVTYFYMVYIYTIMSIKQQIKELAKRNANEVISIRRHIHSYPELSYEEYNTACISCLEMYKV